MQSMIENNTSEHTPAYEQYINILSGNDKKYYFRPADDIATYHITRYLRDSELQSINVMRSNKKLSTIPRLAYIGDGKYIPCNSQKQRRDIELSKFQDSTVNIKPAINKASNGLMEF